MDDVEVVTDRDAAEGGVAPVVRRLAETPGVPCPCGTAYRVVRGADGAPASVHFVAIRRDSERHLHRETTEIYTCLEGTGYLELGGQTVRLEPGTVAVIPPGTPHRAYPDPADPVVSEGEGALRILNVCVPPFRPEDEWPA